jgi:release factor glutamine methyltransferase
MGAVLARVKRGARGESSCGGIASQVRRVAMRGPKPPVYEPAQDTELILANLRVRAGARALEIGTGRGDIAIELARQGARVTATDINPAAVAVALARAQAKGLRVEGLVGDLFLPVRGRFDWVVFNPPYLPTDAQDKVEGPLNAAFDGGPDGLEVTRRFLHGLPARLTAKGRALTIVSSLSPWPSFLEAVPPGLAARVIARTRFAFEEISLVELRRRAPRHRPIRKGVSRCPPGRRSARFGTPQATRKAPRARRPGRP